MLAKFQSWLASMHAKSIRPLRWIWLFALVIALLAPVLVAMALRERALVSGFAAIHPDQSEQHLRDSVGAPNAIYACHEGPFAIARSAPESPAVRACARIHLYRPPLSGLLGADGWVVLIDRDATIMQIRRLAMPN